MANPIGFLMSTARYPRSFSSLVFTGPPFHICPIHGVRHGLPASSQGLNHQRFARPFDVETKQSRSYSNATIYPTRPSLAKHPYFPKFASGGDSLAGELLNDQDLNVQRDMERSKFKSGTSVWMKINNHTACKLNRVFDQFSSKGDFGFTKTVVPVRLAQYGDDKLVSRSQAKRLLARVDRFKTVMFDFDGVDVIGQAFADEVFRVFANKNPDIEIVYTKAKSPVERMIARARS